MCLSALSATFDVEESHQQLERMNSIFTKKQRPNKEISKVIPIFWLDHLRPRGPLHFP